MCFSASDDIKIRQNSVISVFLHLMILTLDKLQRFNDVCFPTCDDINIRQTRRPKRGGAQEHSEEVRAGSAHIQRVGSYEAAGRWVRHVVVVLIQAAGR